MEMLGWGLVVPHHDPRWRSHGFDHSSAQSVVENDHVGPDLSKPHAQAEAAQMCCGAAEPEAVEDGAWRPGAQGIHNPRTSLG